MENTFEADGFSAEKKKLQDLLGVALGCNMTAEFLSAGISRRSGQVVDPKDIEKWASGEALPNESLVKIAIEYIDFQIGGPEGNIP